MTEEIRPVNIEKMKSAGTKPLLLRVLCLFSFVYFGIVAIIFLASTLWADHIASVVNTYVPEDLFTPAQLLLVFGGGFLLNSLALAGSILLWKLRRLGYYLLAGTCLALATFQLLIPRAALTTTGLYIALVVLFGIFFRRLK